jgi:hypothetical protein
MQGRIVVVVYVVVDQVESHLSSLLAVIGLPHNRY